MVWASRNRTRRRQPGDLMRGLLFGARGPARLRGGPVGIVLAHLAALDLCRARRLPPAPRALVALPHVSFVSRVQRRRHRTLDVLPLGRPEAADGHTDRAATAVPRAVCADRRAGVVDGGRVPRAAARRHRTGAVRGPAVLRHSRPHRDALCRHSRRARDGRHARARQRLPGEAGSGHPHADGAALCRRHRRAAAHDSTGAAAARGVVARHHRVLRRPPDAGHRSSAVVLGRRNPLHESAGRPRLAPRRSALDHGAWPGRGARRRLRALAFCRVQQGAGGAQGAIHEAAMAGGTGAGAAAVRPCDATC